MHLRAHQEKNLTNQLHSKKVLSKDTHHICLIKTCFIGLLPLWLLLCALTLSKATVQGRVSNEPCQYWFGTVLCWTKKLCAAEPCVCVKHSRILTQGTLHKKKSVLHLCKTCSEPWDQTYHLSPLLHHGVIFFLPF